MKRRRILSDSEEEEEEEEDKGRRSSLRTRERISYTIYQSDEDREEESAEEEEEEQEDSEQLGAYTQPQHNNQGEQGKSEILEPELLVTCGVKKGSLDVEKLAKGEDCILCERSWFSPTAFEAYAGKGSNKKWKGSIFYNGEPLQTLFDEGILTAKRYKTGRRTSTTKPQKILSSDEESGSSYEELYSGEETEEVDVQGDWLPGKGEKKRQGAESGGGDVNTTEEEEDKIEEGEVEDESVPAEPVIDEDSVREEMQTDFITSAYGKMAARVVLRRLDERTERQSNCPEPEQLEEDSWFMPVEDTPNEGESRQNVSAIDNPCVTAASQTDTSWMPGVKREGDESGERKDGQTDIQTKTPARPLPAPATSSRPEDTISISDDAANIRTSPVPETSTSLTNDMIDNCEERDEHLETIVQPSGVENIKDSLPEKECPEPMSHSLKPLREQADNPTHTDATTSNHEAAQIQIHTRHHRISLFHSDPQASHSSDIEEVSSSRCSAGIDLDTMDLDQLKKEKIKMQIKVLKLQEEYYTMKIQGVRK